MLQNISNAKETLLSLYDEISKIILNIYSYFDFLKHKCGIKIINQNKPLLHEIYINLVKLYKSSFEFET